MGAGGDGDGSTRVVSPVSISGPESSASGGAPAGIGGGGAVMISIDCVATAITGTP